ncbi:MAG: phosphoribosylglycinamide formyltransferase [Ignavibacteriaceae bacterium]
MRIAVFVSGRGSNLKAILDSRETQNNIEVKAVVSDRLDCPAFAIAKNSSILTVSVGNKVGFVGYEQLHETLQSLDVELIVLAGYLKLIPNKFLSFYSGKIINIHPALLPSFGGKGMYGMNVHKAVFESSAKVTGVTVHFVDETYDTGNIIAQRCVDISNVNSPEEIANKVLNVEHEILPLVLCKFAEGKINIIGKRVIIN